MSLVTSKEMLQTAKQYHYEEMNAPVIIQTTPSTVRYASLNLYLSNVRPLAEQAKGPVALHLDHGSSFELCAQALQAGYTSIMIDGSRLPLEQNIAVSARLCGPLRKRRVLRHEIFHRARPFGSGRDGRSSLLPAAQSGKA